MPLGLCSPGRTYPQQAQSSIRAIILCLGQESVIEFRLDWSNAKFSRGRYDSNYRKCSWDDECYKNFDVEELHKRTREMKARLLQDQVVSVFCKHGLHRSAAGARKVGEELATEGYLVWVLNIGCSERWWAKNYKLVEIVPAEESGASYEQVAQRLSIITAEWRSINSSLGSPVAAKHPSSQFDPSHISPPVIHRCQQEVAAASHRPGKPPEAAVGAAEAGSPAPPSPPPAGEPTMHSPVGH